MTQTFPRPSNTLPDALERYRACTWSPDGMEYPNLNCWGFVRLVRHELFGLPLLPAFGVHANDKRGMTESCLSVVDRFLSESHPVPGSIATAWRGRLCVHVGIVVTMNGVIGVLDLDEKAGMTWCRLIDFNNRYLRVIYYT